MCGRYDYTASIDEFSELVDVFSIAELLPRYNIAPTQIAPVIRCTKDEQRELAALRWGLIPFWADDPAIGNRMINARVESAAKKPAYRHAWRKHRCVVPATGFFEWQRTDRGKQPYRIRRRDGEPLFFAGLWDRWRPPDGEPVDSYTILTTRAAGVVRPLHDRMPVMLDAAQVRAWLAGAEQGAPPQPLDPELLETYPVSRIVNSPANDRPECLEPAEQQRDLFE